MSKSLRTPRGPILIRQSESTDAERFRELRLRALMDSPTAFSMDYERASSYPTKYWDETLAMDDRESAIFFAEHGGQLVGMTGIARGRSPKTRHAADIWGVFVSQDWRGLHIAEELIRSCMVWAEERDITILRLAVVAGNKPAIRCYERCGFATYGTEPRSLFYEGKYYDEYLMAIELDAQKD